MKRNEVIRVAIIAIGVIVIAMAMGAAHWSGWGRLAVVTIAVLAGSAGAPEAFGWRTPHRK